MSQFISYKNYKKQYILNETYESYEELLTLSKDVAKEIIGNKFKDEIQLTNYYKDEVMKPEHIFDVKDFVKKDYKIIKDFLDNTNVGVIIHSANRFPYSGGVYVKKDRFEDFLGMSFRTYDPWNEKDKEELLRKKLKNYTCLVVIGLPFAIKYFSKDYPKMPEALLHELNHAYDDYRSKDKFDKSEIDYRYDKHQKSTDKREAAKDSLAYYYRLPHEIASIFVEAIRKTNFYSNNKSQIRNIQDVYNEFIQKYKGYNYLTPKDKKRIARKFSQYYYKIKEKNIHKSYVNEAVTPQINRHMTHAEDLVFISGMEGLNWVISMFKDLYEKLKSNTDSDKVRLSIKFDGAPSIFVWSKFPGMENYGVAIKALFAKNPKLLYNEKQIDHYYGEQKGLAIQLKLMLKYLPSLNIPEGEIWQGDLLFDKSSLKMDSNYYSFHPNTIVYKVEKNSDIGKKIGKSEIGIVWHTRYKGTSLENISAQYDTKISELSDNSKVFMTDPYIASLAGIVTLTDDECMKFEKEINEIELISKNLDKSSVYNEIVKDSELIKVFQIFQNSLIRDNIHIDDTEEYLNKFIEFVNLRFDKEASTKKTEKGSSVILQKKYEFNQKFEDEKYYNEFQLLISLIITISDIKKLFIKKLNNIGKFETYLQTHEDKFITTNQEGFAISDISGNIIKLIDRYEFSFANFSPSIKKGWTK